jgi:chloride channel protein, CIC family
MTNNKVNKYHFYLSILYAINNTFNKHKFFHKLNSYKKQQESKQSLTFFFFFCNMNLNNKIDRFLKWRIKKISDKHFMLILAVVVGIAVGIAAVIIKNSVYLIQKLLVNVVAINYLYFVYPAIGILIVVLFTRYIIRKQLGHGVPMVLHSISKKNGKIDKHNIFSRIIGSSITVGFGGSVGLEGPIVATGAAIGSNLGKILHLNYKQIILLIGCACTGALAAIFNAPIAAIIFTLEVIMLNLTMSSILPLLLASISASLTSYLFMGQNVVYFVEKTEPFLIQHVPYYIILGILAGLLAVYFSKIYLKLSTLFKKIDVWWKKFIAGVLSLGIFLFIFPSLYGEGYEVINACLHGESDFLFENTFYAATENIYTISFLFIMIMLFKAFATGATFGAGGVGGIFAPSLFLGANLGLFFTKVFNNYGFDLPVSNFALVAMAGVMAAVIHAPLTAIFMIAEITSGYELFVPLMIVSALAYFTAKVFMPNSVYTLLLAKRGELLTHHADKNMLTLMKLEELVETNFTTVKASDSLGALVKIISKSSRNMYPVVDDKNVLTGLVSLDHIRHIIFKRDLYETSFVRDLMYFPSEIIDIDKNSPEEVAEKFEQSSYYNLPAVKDGKYIGFISRARLFSSYRELLKDLSEN